MVGAQMEYLRRVLPGRDVDDIGCGCGRRLAPLLDSINYLGFDKEPFGASHVINADLSRPCKLLRHDLAFVSWPVNRIGIAWHLFLREYVDIIYVGANHNGMQCGDPNLWRLLSKREVVHVIPDASETLIHYGPRPRAPKSPVPHEESLGIANWNGGPLVQFSNLRFVAAKI